MGAIFARRFGLILGRIFLVAIGAAAIGWTIDVTPKFRAGAPIADVAVHIIAGETYKEGVLDAFASRSDASGRAAFSSSILSKMAIIRLRQVENAMAIKDKNIIEVREQALGQAVNNALMNAPSDPFLWLVLFWLDNTRNGFSPAHLAYLQMSYELGPNEGWIAVKRNHIALTYFSALTPELKEAAIAEFVGLVRSQFYKEAADIAAGPGRPIRSLLFARLKKIKEGDRQAFANMLYQKGVDDVPIPGIKPPDERPWH